MEIIAFNALQRPQEIAIVEKRHQLTNQSQTARIAGQTNKNNAAQKVSFVENILSFVSGKSNRIDPPTYQSHCENRAGQRTQTYTAKDRASSGVFSEKSKQQSSNIAEQYANIAGPTIITSVARKQAIVSDTSKRQTSTSLQRSAKNPQRSTNTLVSNGLPINRQLTSNISYKSKQQSQNVSTTGQSSNARTANKQAINAAFSTNISEKSKQQTTTSTIKTRRADPDKTPPLGQRMSRR